MPNTFPLADENLENELFVGIAEDKEHIKRLQWKSLEELIDKWLDFYSRRYPNFSDKKLLRDFIKNKINTYTEELSASITALEKREIRRFDPARFELSQSIEAEFQELIFDGRDIPLMAVNYRKNKEEREKQWTESHKVVSRMKKWWSEFFKDVK